MAKLKPEPVSKIHENYLHMKFGAVLSPGSLILGVKITIEYKASKRMGASRIWFRFTYKAEMHLWFQTHLGILFNDFEFW